MESTCSVTGCDTPAKVRGYCKGHYQRVCRTGDPAAAEITKRVAGATPCSVSGCERAAIARTYCGAHYQRWRNTGSAGNANIVSYEPAPPECVVDGCSSKPHGRGMCSMHYSRWERNGDPGPAELLHEPLGPCKQTGCDVVRFAHGYCKKHYRRYRRYGDPDVVEYARWRGTKVGYVGAHLRLRKERGSASEYSCQHCGRQAEDWAYDHCDRNERQHPTLGMPYSVNPARYIPLCKSCHQIFDRSVTVAAAVSPEQWAIIRRWAKDNGWAVGIRGRLAKKVIMAYLQSKRADGP